MIQRTPIRKRERPRRTRPELFFQREPWIVDVKPDGREICNDKTVAGREEYKSRVRMMLRRQNGKCCNCQKPLYVGNATFEHENGRSVARRDDRIEIDGQPVNGASHLSCNSERGSKRTPIWKGEKPVEASAAV